MDTAWKGYGQVHSRHLVYLELPMPKLQAADYTAHQKGYNDLRMRRNVPKTRLHLPLPLRRLYASLVTFCTSIGTKLLVCAPAPARVNRCNSALVGLPNSILLPQQRILNAAAHFVASLKPRDRVSRQHRNLFAGYQHSSALSVNGARLWMPSATPARRPIVSMWLFGCLPLLVASIVDPPKGAV
jgi:hypothetical protein